LLINSWLIKTLLLVKFPSLLSPNSLSLSIVEIKVTIVHTISKTFGSTSEAKLPDNFLDPLNNLTLQYNLIPQEGEEDDSQIGQNNTLVNKFHFHLLIISL